MLNVFNWSLQVYINKYKLYIFSYGKLVTYMNDGTSLKSVRQIRLTEYPEYNLGNTRTSQINNLFNKSSFKNPRERLSHFLLLGSWTNSVLISS